MTTLPLSRLHTLIGQRLVYQNRPYRVVAVLDDGPQLVLQNEEETMIQTNQYNEAWRHVPLIQEVPVHNVRGDGLNPLLPELTTLFSEG